METENLGTSQEATAVETASTTSQKDAVFQFASAALGDVKAPEGQALRSLVTKEVRKAIRLRLFEGVKTGSIKLSRTMDDSKLKKYCSSLINNWLKKDPRFN